MAEVWIHLSGLLVGYLSIIVVKKVTTSIGKLFEPSPKEVALWIQFARIKVALNINEPLVDSVPYTLLSGKTIAIKVKYERLPWFFLFCGRLGHEKGACRTLHRLKLAIEDCKNPGQKEKL
nr:TPA_asm: hypothetical protein HUJ06_026124 [Nelumbo nucifera]